MLKKFTFIWLMPLLVFITSQAMKSKKNINNLVSPTKVCIPVNNYCRKIINALNKNDMDTLKAEIVTTLNNLTYNITVHDKRFYQSVLLCLSNCLLNASETDIEQFISSSNCIVNDFICLPIKTEKTIYVLQLCCMQKSEYDESLVPFTYQLDENSNANNIPIKVIDLTFVMHEKRKNNEIKIFTYKNKQNKKSIVITPVSLSYEDGNITQKIVRSLTSDNHNTAMISQILQKFYGDIPVNLYTNYDRQQEKYFQSLFFCMTMFVGNGFSCAEQAAGKGRLDNIVISRNHISIIEFKYKPHENLANIALQQIKDNNYANPYKNHKKKIHLLGISVDTSLHVIKVYVTGEKYKQTMISPMKKK